jgi:hypothetical protein
MEPVDGVAPVHHSRADEEHVVDGFGRQGSERGGDHRRGVAAQHAAPVDIAGVAHVAADRARRDAEPVVAVLDRDQARPGLPMHLAVPGSGEAGHGGVDQLLDGMATLVGVGEVPDAQVLGELARAEGGRRGWHGVTFVRRVERGISPPARRVRLRSPAT